jgi:isocitrate/isopropylmalate dehydrogenase
VALRNELDLFVNVLHCHSFPGLTSRHENIDIVIIRQNTEGEYAMQEHEVIHIIKFVLMAQASASVMCHNNILERSRCGGVLEGGNTT